MKIGIDASRYGHENATGVEWYSWHIIQGLLKVKDKKDKVVLYSRQKLKLKGAKNKIIGGKRLWTLRHLTKVLRKEKLDTLFVPSHVLPLYLPKHSVITIHDVAFKHFKKSYSFFQYRYLDWSTKFAVKNASKIIVPSETTKKDLIKFYKCDPKKIVVILHGFKAPSMSLDHDVFKSSPALKYFGLSKKSKYILFVGRLENKKNLQRLVKAFEKFSKKHKDYNLVLAGKRGVGFNKILSEVAKRNLAQKVFMPGYVTELEKAALMKHCKVFAFPSLYEGFGLPILEAFYYKKPILASTTGATVEVCGEGSAHLVDAKDVKNMAKGLSKLVDDKGYARKLVKNGSMRLKKFSWTKAARKTLKVLHG